MFHEYAMARWTTAIVGAWLIAALSPSAQPTGGSLDDLRRLFPDPPPESRILMRWWWFGSAVTTPELEREMRAMREAGIGGFEVQPVYPLALDDTATGTRNLPFLSSAFLDALRFAGARARELGLRLDLTLGSGWPYGGPRVTIDRAAGRLRHERVTVPAGSRRVAVPSTGAGERFIAAFVAPSPAADLRKLTEVTDIREGVVQLPAASERSQDVLFFIASRTGMMVKRPALGAEGFVLDHYDRSALDRYLALVGEPLVAALQPNPPYAVFCDSLEVYESDWTTDFLEQFRARRGYDLTPHLPVLVTDVPSDSAALRHDWGQTLTELLNERFVAPLAAWARAQGTRLRLQGYGTPPATVSTNALADLPEGEGAQWKGLWAGRWASSASHIYNRSVTSSETWTWLHSPVFRATPLDLKAEADLHFLQGINQLIGHGWPYSPDGVEYPGWRFYAAGAFNDKNPWWIVMPDLSRYLQRLSFVLRQGAPVTDVALYLPTDDAWAQFSPGKVNLIETLRDRLGPDVIPAVLDAGYAFDFVDDDALKAAGAVEGTTLRVGSARYRAIVVPGVERIPIGTLRALDAFARAGGVVIATRRVPDLAPGFLATTADHAQVREIVHRLFEAPDAAGVRVLDERAQLGAELIRRLRPDLSLSPAVPDIGFVHRRTAAADVYFVANTGNLPQRATATFRVDDAHAELWNALDGHMTPVAAGTAAGGGRSITLDLEPYGSRLVVFSPQARSPVGSLRLPPPSESLDIGDGWTVAFGADGLTSRMNRLRSWTDDERTRYFSGVATYEKEMVVPDRMTGRDVALRLDFGEGRPLTAQRLRSGTQAWLEGPVREAAVVYVNGQRAGSIWCPPYSLGVTALLHRGANTLRILVGNLAVNHMAGHALPSYRLLNLRYGVRFEPQDMDKVQPQPAGLLGPIRLIASHGIGPS